MQEISENLSRLIDRLNPKQKEAVNNMTGPSLIIAGAGSGKTSVLTARIALLLQKGIMPERILALTFTKKAAEEMRSRIISLAGEDAQRLKMGTFHSVFASILRPYAHMLGFSPDFTIMDEEDSSLCLKRCTDRVLGVENRPDESEMTEKEKDYYDGMDARYKPRFCKARISWCKNELMTPSMYELNGPLMEKDKKENRLFMSRIYHEYATTCFRSNVMDFDDILLYTDMLMSNCPDIARRIAASFDYILVDEYQDTNRMQYSILMHLTKENRNICVVGDDSQSIYAFRGARIENILNFNKDFKGCLVTKLEQNYRSTKEIVNAANQLISHNSERLEKTCFSDGSEGDPIELIELPNAYAEAYNITDELLRHKRKEKLQYKDFAILYRTNSQSRLIEECLIKKNIPYIIYSGASFYERMEVKDQMAYFRLAVNPNDDEAFRRAANKPVRGIGNAAMEQTATFARNCGISLWGAVNNPFFTLQSKKALTGMEQFRKIILAGMDAVRTMSAYDAARLIIDECGLYDSLMKTDTQESRNRADNITELLEAVRSFGEDTAGRNEGLKDEDKEDASLKGFLQNAMLMSNADTDDDNKDKVNLMTVHCAKGLEFDTVFVAGMEERLFPLRIENTDFELEEERRLFYVASTRAKNKLYLTRAESRMRFGKNEKTKLSSFVTEMLGELVYD